MVEVIGRTSEEKEDIRKRKELEELAKEVLSERWPDIKISECGMYSLFIL